MPMILPWRQKKRLCVNAVIIACNHLCLFLHELHDVSCFLFMWFKYLHSFWVSPTMAVFLALSFSVIGMWALRFISCMASLCSYSALLYSITLTFCLISQKAYHLGQEETDWFEKPREPRSDRSRHHGSGSHSSSSRRSNVKHTYHDYDEPPEEDLWPQDEYGHQRHPSSTSSREHRHHVSSSGRHSSSRHSSDDPRSTRSTRAHPKDPSARTDTRSSSSTSQKRSSDPRSVNHRDSGDYSRDPSGHHHGSSGQRGQRQPSSSRRQEPSSTSRQQHGEQQAPSQQGQQRSSAGQQAPAKQPPETAQQGQQQLGQTTRMQQQSPQQPGQQPAAQMGTIQPTTTVAGTGTGTTQQQPKPGQAPAQTRQQPGGPATAQPAAAMVSFHSLLYWQWILSCSLWYLIVLCFIFGT